MTDTFLTLGSIADDDVYITIGVYIFSRNILDTYAVVLLCMIAFLSCTRSKMNELEKSNKTISRSITLNLQICTTLVVMPMKKKTCIALLFRLQYHCKRHKT